MTETVWTIRVALLAALAGACCWIPAEPSLAAVDTAGTFRAAKWGMNLNVRQNACTPPAIAFVWTIGGGWYDDRDYTQITFENQVFVPEPSDWVGCSYMFYASFDLGLQTGLRRSVHGGALTVGPTLKTGLFAWYASPLPTVALGVSLGISEHDTGQSFQFVFEPKVRFVGTPCDGFAVLELSFYWGTVEWQ